MTNEAHLDVNGYLNKQHNRYKGLQILSQFRELIIFISEESLFNVLFQLE